MKNEIKYSEGMNENDIRGIEFEENKQIELTEASKKLFIDYANDSRNWGGNPLVDLDGNVRTSKELRGNLTDLKRKGLIETFKSDDCLWIHFTETGKEFAKYLGINLGIDD